MHQEAVSPRSWGPGDTGDESPDKFCFALSLLLLLALLVMNVQLLLGQRNSKVPPARVHACPDAAWPSLIPCARAGLQRALPLWGPWVIFASAAGTAVVLTAPPPRYPPHPGTLCFLPSPLLSPCCFWVAACPPSFRCPDWEWPWESEYSFGHPFEYM